MIRSIADQKAAHILAHTLLGAAVAAAGGNDALSAGLAAGGAEAAAPVLARWLYGTDDPEQLTPDQKQTISSIAGLAGAATGAATGNMADVVAGSMGAQNAVENNAHLRIGEYEKFREEYKACKDQKCKNDVNRRLEKKQYENQRELYAACDQGRSSWECVTLRESIDKSRGWGSAGWLDYRYPTGRSVSLSLGGAFYLGFGGNAKVDLVLGNRASSVQAEGGYGIGFGAKLKGGKVQHGPVSVTPSSTSLPSNKHNIGTQPSDKNVTVSTKVNIELNAGPLGFSANTYGGREFGSDGKSSLYKGGTLEYGVQPQVGAGIQVNADVIHGRTRKYEHKNR